MKVWMFPPHFFSVSVFLQSVGDLLCRVSERRLDVWRGETCIYIFIYLYILYIFIYLSYLHSLQQTNKLQMLKLYSQNNVTVSLCIIFTYLYMCYIIYILFPYSLNIWSTSGRVKASNQRAAADTNTSLRITWNVRDDESVLISDQILLHTHTHRHTQ